MADTTFLQAPFLIQNQAQPHIPLNTTTGVEDAAIGGQVTINFATDANYSITASGATPQQWQYAVIRMTDTGPVLTNARDVIWPDKTRRGSFVFVNSTAQILTVKRTGQTGVAVAAGSTTILRDDGTDVISVIDYSPTLDGFTSTGIGVIDVSSTSPALRVTQRGTGSAIRVEDSTTPDASPFVVDNNGMTLVGYDTAIAIGGNSSYKYQQYALDTSTGISLQRYSANGGGVTMAVGKSRGATFGAFDTVTDTTQLFSLDVHGSDGTDMGTAGARMRLTVDGTPASDIVPTKWEWSTMNVAGSFAVRFSISAAGIVAVTSSQAASSTTTGALTVTGGVGIGGALYTGGLLNVTGTATVSGQITQNAGLNVGYLEIPQNTQAGNYTAVLADSGKHIFHDSGAGAGDTYTIPANGSVAYPVGTTLTFVNRDTNTVSIAITTDTMYLAGSTTTGTRTLAENGVATAIKVASTVWIISGSGLT